MYIQAPGYTSTYMQIGFLSKEYVLHKPHIKMGTPGCPYFHETSCGKVARTQKIASYGTGNQTSADCKEINIRVDLAMV